MTKTNPITWTNPDSSTPEEREQVKFLYSQGMTYEEIGKKIGRGTTFVHRWVKDYSNIYKIQEWKGKATQEEKDRAVIAYETYQSIPKVCEELDRSYDAIYRWLKEAGIDTSHPQPHYKKKPTKKQNKELERKVSRLETRIIELEAQNGELRNVIATLATFNNL